VKKVLFIAYHFPPIGGAGVQRSAKFARYLPESGYAPVIVTGPGPLGMRWTPSDRSLLRELPENTGILRVAGPEPHDSRGRRGRAERILRLRSPFAKWWIDGIGATVAAAAPDFDVIVASMSPFESAVAAARLARQTGRPWIADLRDPWALDEMQVFPSRLHRELELRRMRRLLRSADAIVANTPEAERRLRQIPQLADKTIVVIPNGYDATDFSNGQLPAADDRIRIVHAGYLHTELGTRLRRRRLMRRALGGAIRGVDVLARSHVHLVDAIARLVAVRPELADRLELHLVGALSEADRDIIRDNPIVHTHGFLAHRDAVELVRTADLLFLPMHGLPPGTRATIVPGKTYEYLASRKPIIATVPDGDARDILSTAGGVVFAPPGDAARLADALGAAIDTLDTLAREAGGRNADLLATFERRALSARLAAALDAVGRTPATAEPAAVRAAAG
jgi:glycosyltransferase involved in cell wall biosynthesis